MSEQGVFRFVKQFYESITRIETYRDRLRGPLCEAIVFMVVVTLSLGTLSMIRPILEFNRGIRQVTIGIEKDLPDFILKDGQLTAAKPFLMRKGKQSIIIMDTSEVHRPEEMEGYTDGVFIGKDRIILQQNGFIRREMRFDEFAGVEFTKEDLVRFLPYLQWLDPLILIFGWFGFFIGKLCSAIILSLLGFIIAARLQTRMGFKGLYKLSIYALSLPIALKVLLSFTGLTVPFFWVIYYGAALIYLGLALSEIKQANDLIG